MLESRPTDFIAVLKYRTSEEGGRKTPANSGYMPQIKFPFTETQTGGHQTFVGKDLVQPGETIEAEIKLLFVEHFENTLVEGQEFEIREGTTVMGTGKIKQILNEKLIKANNTSENEIIDLDEPVDFNKDRKEEPLVHSEQKQWWESRRRKYNKALVLAGITAFILYAILGEFLLMPYVHNYEITLFTIFFQGVGYLIMMGIANVFYGLGSFVDKHFNKGNSEQFRTRLYNFGFWFSVALPFLIPTLVVVEYFVLYRK